MKKLLAASLLAASIATPAFSADMAVKAPRMFVSPAYDWSGLYVGGAMGGTWGRFDNTAVNVPAVGEVSTSFSNFTGAGIAGVQKQFGGWVVGAEFTWNSDITDINSAAIPTTPGITYSNKIKDLATVGAKLGYAGWTNFMVYGEGGYAQARVSYELVNADGSPDSPFSGSAQASGWYAGAGIDYVLSRGTIFDWILGAEYEHVGLQDKFNPSVNATNAVSYGAKDLDIARVRLTMKFNPWATVSAH